MRLLTDVEKIKFLQKSGINHVAYTGTKTNFEN